MVLVAAPDLPLVSVVVPLFNEQESLTELYRRLVTTFESARIDFEIVFVNDGSKDGTANLLEAMHQSDRRVVVLTLSRNFGHQAAISAGIDHATGQGVIVMDGDLQDPPEVLPLFVSAWQQGNDVVYAVRTKRKENIFKRFCYSLFYRTLRAASALDIPLDSGDFCLMDRKVVDALKALPEHNRFVRGLRTFVGFKQVGLAYERAARQAGQAKYTFRALCRLAIDGLMNFTDAPMRFLTGAGLLCLALTLVGAGEALLRSWSTGVPGWWIATLAVVGCTGLQLLGMRILGEYVRRTFWEIKGRPTYIVATIQRRQATSLSRCA